MAAPFLERRGGDVRLRVRLTPGARREEFAGSFEDSEGRIWLKASVRVAPEKGKANAALIAALAKRSGIAAGRTSLVSGDVSRAKTLFVADCSAAEEAALAALGEGG